MPDEASEETLRRLSPKTLIVVGSLVLSIALPISTGMGFFFEDVRRAAIEAEELRFGPFEWVWRSLTYGRPQPMARA